MTFPDPPVPSSCKVIDGDTEPTPFITLLSSPIFFVGGFSVFPCVGGMRSHDDVEEDVVDSSKGGSSDFFGSTVDGTVSTEEFGLDVDIEDDEEVGVEEDTVFSEDVGAAEDVGASDDAGIAEEAGAADETGLAEDVGASEDTGVAEDAGAADEVGIMEDVEFSEETGVVEVSDASEEGSYSFPIANLTTKRSSFIGNVSSTEAHHWALFCTSVSLEKPVHFGMTEKSGRLTLIV